MPSSADTAWVVAQAKIIGFDLCGVVPILGEDVAPVGDENEARSSDLGRFEEWLGKGYAGEMHYLRDPRRAHPSRALPEACSVIVCALNYNSGKPYSTEAAAQAAAGLESRGWISRYAWGDDYHDVVLRKLNELVAALRGRFGADLLARAYVDTGPVAERAVARDAGLGWLAKNTCLINDALGSWLFLGVVLTSLDLPALNSAATTPPPDLCGNCRLCLDACPTGALVEPYVLDARRCISYLTIELRDEIPEELRPAMGWQIFGCDICQDVCPWNRTAPVTTAPEFHPREKFFAPELAWLLSLTEQDFRAAFRGSPVKRAKWRGLLRNACIAAGNAAATLDPGQRVRLRSCLAQLSAGGDALIASHARWALARLGAD